MDKHQTALERAFELARSGKYRSMDDLRHRLSREGYDRRQLDGRALSRQLRGLMASASAADPALNESLD